MDNFFTNTMANISFKTVAPHDGTDEHPFISDLFNDLITEVGHIQFIPPQNCLRLTVARADGDLQMYYINEPKLEFLKFLFHNTNKQVKKAIRFYFQNSTDAQKQHRETKSEAA